MITLGQDSPHYSKVWCTKRAKTALFNFKKNIPIARDTKFMGGVDRGHQLRTYHTCSRKAQYWWKKVLCFLMDIARIIGYISYFDATPLHDRSNQRCCIITENDPHPVCVVPRQIWYLCHYKQKHMKMHSGFS